MRPLGVVPDNEVLSRHFLSIREVIIERKSSVYYSLAEDVAWDEKIADVDNRVS